MSFAAACYSSLTDRTQNQRNDRPGATHHDVGHRDDELGAARHARAVRRVGVSALQRRLAARHRGRHRSSARPAPFDCRQPPAGHYGRGHQHDDRAVPDQRAVRGRAGAPPARRRMVRPRRAAQRDRCGPRRPLARASAGAGLAALGNAAVALCSCSRAAGCSTWVVAVAGACRIAGIAWNIMVAPVYATERSRRDRRQRARARAIGRRRPRWPPRSKRSEQARAPIDRGWTLSLHRDAVRDSHRPDAASTARCSASSHPRVAVLGDMVDRRLIDAARDQPAVSGRGAGRPAGSSAACGAGTCALRTGRRDAGSSGSRAPGCGGGCDFAIRMRAARYLGAGRAQPGAADRAAARRDPRGDGAGLGHELVLRHRELGRRHVELVGRVAHRHVARGDGPRGARSGGRRPRRRRPLRGPAAGRRPATSRSSSSATPAKATRRSTCSAISCCRCRTSPTCASWSSLPTSSIRPAR